MSGTRSRPPQQTGPSRGDRPAWDQAPSTAVEGLPRWVVPTAAGAVVVALLVGILATSPIEPSAAPPPPVAPGEPAAPTPARPLPERPVPAPRVDVAKPVIRIEAPSEERTEHSVPFARLAGRVEDESAVTFTLDGRTLLLGSGGTFDVQIPLEASRETTVLLEARDAAGNEARAQRVFLHVPPAPAWEAPLAAAKEARERGDAEALKAALEEAEAQGVPTTKVLALQSWLRTWELEPALVLHSPVDGATIGGTAEQGYLIGVRGMLVTGRTSDRLFVDGREAPRNASGEFDVTVRRPFSATASGPAELTIVLVVRDGDEVRKRSSVGVRLYVPPTPAGLKPQPQPQPRPEPEWKPKRANDQELQHAIDLLQDRNSGIAFAATISLGKLGDLRAVPGLLQALRSGKDFYVRLGAADALRELKSCDGVPGLIAGLDDRDDLVRSASNMALQGITQHDKPFLPTMDRTELRRLQGDWRAWWTANEAEVRKRWSQSKTD